MKKIFLSFTFFVFTFSLSQAQESLTFSYDEAGNQIERETPAVKSTSQIPSLPIEFKIYPNPTSGKFYIEWTEAYKGKVLQIAIIPMSGTNIIAIKQIGDNDLKFEFDMSSQLPGVYPISVWLKDGKFFLSKIIKL